jgi:hypothetical protein
LRGEWAVHQFVRASHLIGREEPNTVRGHSFWVFGRNFTTVDSKPISSFDKMNFGSPKPAIVRTIGWQFTGIDQPRMLFPVDHVFRNQQAHSRVMMQWSRMEMDESRVIGLAYLKMRVVSSFLFC